MGGRHGNGTTRKATRRGRSQRRLARCLGLPAERLFPGPGRHYSPVVCLLWLRHGSQQLCTRFPARPDPRGSASGLGFGRDRYRLLRATLFHRVPAFLRGVLHRHGHTRDLHILSFRHASRCAGEPVSLVSAAVRLGTWALRTMAGAQGGLIGRATSGLGRLVANYSRAAINFDRTEVLNEGPLPQGPTVWIGWHEANLIALALHSRVAGREAMAFVPPGLNGAGMRGWLEGLNIAPVPLAADARRGLGLRQMETALNDGKDILIAVDGPSGPRHRIAPGATWLARAGDVEIRPVGASARPCLRLPRWDRLIVPLPGARVALVIGEALSFTHEDPAHAISGALERLTERARLATLKRLE